MVVDGFGKDKNVAAFFLNGTPHGHKQTIAQVLADNPKIPAFLFSAGAGQVNNIASKPVLRSYPRRLTIVRVKSNFQIALNQDLKCNYLCLNALR